MASSKLCMVSVGTQCTRKRTSSRTLSLPKNIQVISLIKVPEEAHITRKHSSHLSLPKYQNRLIHELPEIKTLLEFRTYIISISLLCFFPQKVSSSFTCSTISGRNGATLNNAWSLRVTHLAITNLYGFSSGLVRSQWFVLSSEIDYPNSGFTSEADHEIHAASR